MIFPANIIAVSQYAALDPDAPTGSLLWYLSMAVVVEWIVVFAFLIKAMRAASRHRRILVSAEAYIYDRRDEPPFGVNIVIAVFLIEFALGIIAVVATHQSADKTQTVRLYEALEAIATLALVAVAAGDVMPALKRFGSAYWYLFAAAWSVVTYLFSDIWLRLLHLWMTTQTLNMSAEQHANGFSWLTIFLLFAVFTPIVEELAFRGIVLSRLRRALSDNEAIVATSMMFVILHMSVIASPELLLLALLLGVIRVRSGSLWPCFLLHGMHNAFCFAGEQWGF